MAEIKAQSGSESVELMLADLASQESVCQLMRDYKDRYQQLDVLINNAGTYLAECRVTVDGIETMFAVNYPSIMRFLYKLFKLFLKSPEKSAETSIYLASSPEVEGITGKYFVNKKEAKSSKESYDETLSLCSSRLY